MAEKDGKKIAVEIETGKSDWNYNLQKCLDAGFGEVVFLALDGKTEKKIMDSNYGRKTKILKISELISPGRLKSRKRIRIPFTLPGERIQIKLNLIAPNQPGSCYAEWKIVDDKGKILLPHQKPIFVFVDVVD